MQTKVKPDIHEVMETLLFHGTSEKIVGELKGGPFDGILWTAECPAVAQNYIPSSGIKTYVGKPDEMYMDDKVRPTDIWLELAEMLGYEAVDIEYDSMKQPISWKWKNNKTPTYGELVQFLEKTLGYEPNYYGVYELKTSIKDRKHIIYPADYKLEGELYILSGKEKLRIFDYAEGREGDLTDVDYLKFGLFKAVQEKGYDAIRIHDFAQSEKWGNVGHISVGLFPSGIKKLSIEKIKARNFDWDDDVTVKITPEFEEWYRAKFC